MLNNLVDNLKDPSSYVYMLFAVLAIGGAIVMINSTKVVHMVASIAVTFLSLAGFYLMLDAEFLALVQVLIYAGAISILMIFGIMMTNHREAEQDNTKMLHSVLTGVGILGLFGILYYVIQKATFPAVHLDPAASTSFEIGNLLMSKYVIPFELMSVLLTVAFVGAIMLAKREGD